MERSAAPSPVSLFFDFLLPAAAVWEDRVEVLFRFPLLTLDDDVVVVSNSPSFAKVPNDPRLDRRASKRVDDEYEYENGDESYAREPFVVLQGGNVVVVVVVIQASTEHAADTAVNTTSRKPCLLLLHMFCFVWI